MRTQIGHLLGVVLVMRDAVVLLGDADLRISALAEFARHHEGEDAGDVGLPGGGDEVEHEADVFVEEIGHADGGVEGGLALVAFGALDAALDFAHVVEIVGETCAVAGAEAAGEVAGFGGNRIENAALLSDASGALAGGAGLAEDALEGDARIGLHGQRRGGRAPGDGVHVRAAEAGRAAADVAGEIFGGEFDGGQRGVLTDLLRDDLIDGGVGENVLAFGALGPDAGEEAGAADGVVADLGAGMRAREVGDDEQLVLVRFERFEDGRELEAACRFVSGVSCCMMAPLGK